MTIRDGHFHALPKSEPDTTPPPFLSASTALPWTPCWPFEANPKARADCRWVCHRGGDCGSLSECPRISTIRPAPIRGRPDAGNTGIRLPSVRESAARRWTARGSARVDPACSEEPSPCPLVPLTHEADPRLRGGAPLGDARQAGLEFGVVDINRKVLGHLVPSSRGAGCISPSCSYHEASRA